MSVIQTAPSKRSVLIADDDAIFRTVVSEMADTWGYSPITVDNGEAALRVLAQPRPPTIAILDWLMPKATGTEICRQVRSHNLPQYIYFILVSARDAHADTLEGLRSGADAYISKPLDAEELRTKLEIAERILLMEESVRDLHAETELFINSVPSILIGTDASGRIIRWNAAAVQAFGLSRQQVEQRLVDDSGIRWSGPGLNAQVENALKNGVVCRMNEQEIRKDGAPRLLALNIHPLRSHLGAIVGSIIVGADVTERKALEDQLRQSQKLEAIGQLAAGIAHEINTPTQFVSDNVSFFKDSWGAVAELLVSARRLVSKNGAPSASGPCFEIAEAGRKIDVDYLTAEIPKALDETLDGLQRISKIVRAMKEFSHPGSDQKNDADLNRAIQNTITVARSEWRYVADLETDLDPSLPLVSCVVDQFNQVILNIVVNAAHAIAEVVGDGNRGKGRITVRTRRVGDAVEISIADTGKGVPEDIRDRIFEPFFSTKEVGRGTGQGLAMAHSAIVNQHQGKIWFESEAGKGTVFFIRLPLSDSKKALSSAQAAQK